MQRAGCNLPFTRGGRAEKCSVYIYGRPKPIYGHTDTDMVGNCHIQIRLYGVSGYAVLPYVQFWPALNIVFVVMSVFKRCITHP